MAAMSQQEQIDALQQRVKMLEERLSSTVGKVECGDSAWEIVAYKHVPTSETLKKAVIVGQNSQYWQAAVDNVEKEYVIHSIRVNDTVYSVGDKCKPGRGDDPLTIVSMEPDKYHPHRCKIWYDSGTWHWHNYVEHATSVTPILTTEDGAKCYDGERVLHGLRITNWNTATKEVKHIDQTVKYDKWFSTQEARTEYIKHNKPCLSRADVRNILNISVRQVGVPYRDVVWEELNKIVEQKLTNK